jgi:hypothetical protein
MDGAGSAERVLFEDGALEIRGGIVLGEAEGRLEGPELCLG